MPEFEWLYLVIMPAIVLAIGALATWAGLRLGQPQVITL